MSNETKLPYRCDAVSDFDRYEYQTTEGQRKCWDGDPDLSKEGWEEWAEWERFEFTEERYWRRPLSDEQIAETQRAKADRAADAARTTAKIEAERAVIEAAEALYDCYTLEDQSKDFWKTDPVLSPRLASLFFKVEALQEARDG